MATAPDSSFLRFHFNENVSAKKDSIESSSTLCQSPINETGPSAVVTTPHPCMESTVQSGGDPRPSLIVFTPYPCMESTLQGGIEAMVIPIGSVAAGYKYRRTDSESNLSDDSGFSMDDDIHFKCPCGCTSFKHGIDPPLKCLAERHSSVEKFPELKIKGQLGPRVSNRAMSVLEGHLISKTKFIQIKYVTYQMDAYYWAQSIPGIENSLKQIVRSHYQQQEVRDDFDSLFNAATIGANFINYDIIRDHIMVACRNLCSNMSPKRVAAEDAEEKYEKYFLEFSQYRVFSCPNGLDIPPQAKEGTVNELMIKVETDPNSFKVEDIDSLRVAVRTILNLPESVKLVVTTVKQGCVEIYFNIYDPEVKPSFSLTLSQKRDLIKKKIIRLEFNKEVKYCYHRLPDDKETREAIEDINKLKICKLNLQTEEQHTLDCQKQSKECHLTSCICCGQKINYCFLQYHSISCEVENQSTSSESDGAQPDSESNSESAVFTDQDKVNDEYEVTISEFPDFDKPYVSMSQSRFKIVRCSTLYSQHTLSTEQLNETTSELMSSSVEEGLCSGPETDNIKCRRLIVMLLQLILLTSVTSLVIQACLLPSKGGHCTHSVFYMGAKARSFVLYGDSQKFVCLDNPKVNRTTSWKHRILTNTSDNLTFTGKVGHGKTYNLSTLLCEKQKTITINRWLDREILVIDQPGYTSVPKQLWVCSKREDSLMSWIPPILDDCLCNGFSTDILKPLHLFGRCSYSSFKQKLNLKLMKTNTCQYGTSPIMEVWMCLMQKNVVNSCDPSKLYNLELRGPSLCEVSIPFERTTHLSNRNVIATMLFIQYNSQLTLEKQNGFQITETKHHKNISHGLSGCDHWLLLIAYSIVLFFCSFLLILLTILRSFALSLVLRNVKEQHRSRNSSGAYGTGRNSNGNCSSSHCQLRLLVFITTYLLLLSMLANFCILTVFQEIRTYHCWQKSMKIYFLDLETGTTLSLRAEVYHEIKLGKNRRENECKVWHNLDHCGTIHWKMDCTKESAIVILPDSKEEGFWKLQYHTLGLVFKSDVSFCSTAVKSIYWTVKLQSNDSEILNCSKNTLFLWTTLTECKFLHIEGRTICIRSSTQADSKFSKTICHIPKCKFLHIEGRTICIRSSVQADSKFTKTTCHLSKEFLHNVQGVVTVTVLVEQSHAADSTMTQHENVILLGANCGSTSLQVIPLQECHSWRNGKILLFDTNDRTVDITFFLSPKVGSCTFYND